MYKKILVAIDYDDEASWDKALPLAVEEAKLHGAALSAVSVVPEILKLPNLPDNYGDGAIQHVTQTIEGERYWTDPGKQAYGDWIQAW